MTKCVFVESIKGGVGKTIVSVNLAKQLSAVGKTALIDADLDSSNFHDVVPVDGEIQTNDSWKFEPYEWGDIEVFSMSLLADPEKTVSMTGNRYGRIVNDVVTRSDWSDIDFYVVDVPAGLSDIWRTLLEVFADVMIGSIIVMQPAAITDAKRLLRMHNMSDIPVVGVIENMSYFKCPECDEVYNILGDSIIDGIAETYDVEALGKIPLSQEIAERIEAGTPSLPDDMLEPIEKAANKITSMERDKIGIAGRIREKIVKIGREKMAEIIGSLINTANRSIDIDGYQSEYGFNRGEPVNFIVLNEEGKELLGYQLVARDNLLKVKGSPENMETPQAEIVLDFATLARIVMGEKKIGSTVVDYDATDAYLLGDAKVYGTGKTPWAVKLVRLLEDPRVSEPIREKYGSILEKLI